MSDSALTDHSLIGKVRRLERVIETLPITTHCPVRHYFAGGLYAREMTIPGGCVLTGMVHKHEHLCTISQGRIFVPTEQEVREIAAPHTFRSLPGTKRVGFAVETTVWTTYHWVGEETDLDKITVDIVEATREQLLGGALNLQYLNAEAVRAREDYRKFLEEFDLTDEEMSAFCAIQHDRVDMPPTVDTVDVRASAIHGIGLFARRAIQRDEPIAPVRIGARRTPAGWSINHSPRPNAWLDSRGGNGLVALALRDIRPGEELTVDYRHSMAVEQPNLKPRELEVKL